MPRRHPSSALVGRGVRLIGALSPMGLGLALGACAHHRVAIVDVSPPPPALVAAAPIAPIAPAGPSPINANLSQAATIWHLRAALNVAALGCRGPQQTMLASQYNALLNREKGSFAVAQVALSAEYRAGGSQWQDRYDHAMTRLYNFFSTAQAHDRFCAAAVQVMAQIEPLSPGALPTYAAERLLTMDAAFIPAPQPSTQTPASFSQSVIALAAAPTPTQPTARPRLELDLPPAPGN